MTAPCTFMPLATVVHSLVSVTLSSNEINGRGQIGSPSLSLSSAVSHSPSLISIFTIFTADTIYACLGVQRRGD